MKPVEAAFVTTANELPGCRIVENLGVVRGLVVRAQSFGQGLSGGLASIFGGNIAAYEEVCEAARSDAASPMTNRRTAEWPT